MSSVSNDTESDWVSEPEEAEEESADASSASQSRSRHRRRRQRKQVAWYDTATGKLNPQPLERPSYTSQWRHYSNTARSSKNPLFSLKESEDEDPWVDEDLFNDIPDLPESDLLEAILAYSGHYYANAVDGDGKEDFNSLDGTALLATGIILEELGKLSLGKTGYKVLLEREDSTDADNTDASGNQSAEVIRKRSNSAISTGTSILSGTDKESRTSRKRKRVSKKPRLGSSAAEFTDVETDESRVRINDE